MKGTLTISRRSNGKIYVSMRDELSRVHFVEAEIKLDQFAMALTGLSEIPVELSVKQLEAVGKKKITKQRFWHLPGHDYKPREALEAILIEKAQEPGWLIDPSLSSKSSIDYGTDKNGNKVTILAYRLYKYVDADDDEPVEG